jgi:formate hydrogenlyase subunit 3/multisubunit Na+/H+ antiporter MnhD subunit
MTLIAAALVILLAGMVGAGALRSPHRALHLGAAAGGAACVLGAAASAASLLSGSEQTLRVNWSPPINALSFGLDPLSAFFLLCIFVVGGLALLYAAGYFAEAAARRPVGHAVAWMQGLIAAMAMVVLARDVISFLVAWEAMFLTSYFLVTFDDDEEHVQAAGFTYLVASHISVVLLFILFGLLMRQTGSLDFEAFAATPLSSNTATLCFGIALLGFGIKAGLWPLHGWLPEAHPAAPSPVSALMSGVMIKLGIYGLLRTLTFLGPPPVAWAIALLAVGSLSALAGVLLAVAQNDLKRLLAYCSVENIGIITMGIGIGLLGQAAQAPSIAVAGFGGALLHTLNHGLFKGLLFQAAGAVVHATGSRDIESHGGLLRRMPRTGALFFVGAVAIAGLPPLNGFASEWLIYVAALRHGTLISIHGASGIGVVVVPVLAMVSGLAAACFVKAFGVVFLGEPRSPASAQAHEVGAAMQLSMGLGAAACVAIGVAPAVALRLVVSPAADLAGAGSLPADLAGSSLIQLSLVTALFSGVIVVLALGRKLLLARRDVRKGVTWDCGYALPSSRIQYSGASFAEPVLDPFQGLLHARIQRTPVEELFPHRAVEEVHFEDPGEAAVGWMIGKVVAPLTRVRALQRGPVQLYLLYVLVTLILLLVWQVRA